MVDVCHMSALKTTVYLDETEYDRLKAIARSDGRKPADLLREAVAQYTARRDRTKTPRSVGRGRSGGKNLSERIEELLEGFGKRR
jgi:hypothetical protein